MLRHEAEEPGEIAAIGVEGAGGGELPIHADIVGRTFTVEGRDRIEVLVPEVDQESGVELVKGSAA
jgi:pyrimidine operon attenuation protein/uracil phosphoribosyltransferase